MAQPSRRPRATRDRETGELRLPGETSEVVAFCSKSNSDRSTGSPPTPRSGLLDAWITRARRCRLPSFVKLARRRRQAAIDLHVTLVVPGGKITRARRAQRVAGDCVALIKPHEERGHGREIRLARATQSACRQPRGVVRTHRGGVALVDGSESSSCRCAICALIQARPERSINGCCRKVPDIG